MQEENIMSYALNVISNHRDFSGKTLRKYLVDGIETVGAYGNENFEIEFKNNTYETVQVKITLDGTDVATGKAATTEPTGKMWVVNGYGTLRLKAWAETNEGGSSFVFTNGLNGVSVNLRGDTSNNGIIAAAVYKESYVAPYVLPTITYIYPNDCTYGTTTVPITTTYTDSISRNDFTLHNTTIGSGGANAGISMNSSNKYLCNTNSLQSVASVGAGDYTNQKINNVPGLIKPLLSETIRVKYIWWDALVAKLRSANVPTSHASGFPGDKPTSNFSLGSVPHVPTNVVNYRAVQQNYARV